MKTLLSCASFVLALAVYAPTTPMKSFLMWDDPNPVEAVANYIIWDKDVPIAVLPGATNKVQALTYQFQLPPCAKHLLSVTIVGKDATESVPSTNVSYGEDALVYTPLAITKAGLPVSTNLMPAKNLRVFDITIFARHQAGVQGFKVKTVTNPPAATP